MAAPAYGAAWRRFRLLILKRDGYLCQLKLSGCTTIATTVDHIDKVATHGRALPPADRARAACKHCNSSDGAAWGNRRRGGGPSRDWWS